MFFERNGISSLVSPSPANPDGPVHRAESQRSRKKKMRLESVRGHALSPFRETLLKGGPKHIAEKARKSLRVKKGRETLRG